MTNPIQQNNLKNGKNNCHCRIMIQLHFNHFNNMKHHEKEIRHSTIMILDPSNISTKGLCRLLIDFIYK
jgi:hypothetical protein